MRSIGYPPIMASTQMISLTGQWELNPVASFDRTATLAELLPDSLALTLLLAVDELLGCKVVFCEFGGSEALQVALTLELEPIAYLTAIAAEGRDAPKLSQLEAAASLVKEVLRSRLRYRMASELHDEVSLASFEQLKRDHAALEVSEASYKALSADLEKRVEAQVAILEQRQRQLYEAEKLASVGQLAAGVAHEINNPIGFVRSNLETFSVYLGRVAALGEKLDQAKLNWKALGLDFVVEDGRELVTESIAGIDRVARIVKDLRGFSNIDRPDEEMVDLNDSLTSACAVVACQLPADVKLTKALSPLPPLMCLPGHLSQVWLNVLQNAVQAVGQRGTIRVASGIAGNSIFIEVADDGQGISDEVLAHVFEPFFTTREVGKGTGLGLTVARDIVGAHGGEIGIESTVGQGTKVTITLPI
jgi:signal transduction histidine kinase